MSQDQTVPLTKECGAWIDASLKTLQLIRSGSATPNKNPSMAMVFCLKQQTLSDWKKNKISSLSHLLKAICAINLQVGIKRKTLIELGYDERECEQFRQQFKGEVEGPTFIWTGESYKKRPETKLTPSEKFELEAILFFPKHVRLIEDKLRSTFRGLHDLEPRSYSRFLRECRRALGLAEPTAEFLNDEATPVVRRLCLDASVSRRILIGAVREARLGATLTTIEVRTSVLRLFLESYLLLVVLTQDLPRLPAEAQSKPVQRAYSLTKLGAELRNALRDERALEIEVPSPIVKERLRHLGNADVYELEAPDEPEALADPSRIAGSILAKKTSLPLGKNRSIDWIAELQKNLTRRFETTRRRPYAVFNCDALINKDTAESPPGVEDAMIQKAGTGLPPGVEDAMIQLANQLDAICRQKSVDCLEYRFQEISEAAEPEMLSLEIDLFDQLTELVGLFNS